MRILNHYTKMTLTAAMTLTSITVWAASDATLFNAANYKVKEVIAVQEMETEKLMENEGVIGTAVGLDEQNNLVMKVYVNSEHPNMAEIIPTLPKGIAGVPVKIEVTEPFRPMLKFKPMDGGPAHKTKQTPPIQLGTSGGWRYDLANGFCCGGTLGSLVAKSGKQYILSNYHVFRSDIVNGGNNRIALNGDPIIQPGLIDRSCNAGSAQNVATLAGPKSLPNSNVDAAIAQVIPGMVRSNGAILDIGPLSSQTVAAALNQAVKKSGRTTGLTRSIITGLNATVSVAYDNECAGNSAFTKTFKGQILIKNINKGVSFLSGGDSGSLMVQDVSTKPKAIGLLFAGSSTTAVANPIGQVLKFFGASMVGN